MVVQQEEKHARKALQHHTGNNTGATADARSNDLHPAQEEVFLFDLVRTFFEILFASSLGLFPVDSSSLALHMYMSAPAFKR